MCSCSGPTEWRATLTAKFPLSVFYVCVRDYITVLQRDESVWLACLESGWQVPLFTSYIIKIYLQSSVADPGFVKREGRKSKFRQAWKSRSAGGGGLWYIFSPDFFLPSFTLLGRGTVRLPDRPPGWQAKTKNKNKNRPKKRGGGGGRGQFGPPPPGSATGHIRWRVGWWRKWNQHMGDWMFMKVN